MLSMPDAGPLIVEAPAHGPCPLPHFTRDGRPKDVPAYRYREWFGASTAHPLSGRSAVACRAHAPEWARAGMPAPLRRASEAQGQL